MCIWRKNTFRYVFIINRDKSSKTTPFLTRTSSIIFFRIPSSCPPWTPLRRFCRTTFQTCRPCTHPSIPGSSCSQRFHPPPSTDWVWNKRSEPFRLHLVMHLKRRSMRRQASDNSRYVSLTWWRCHEHWCSLATSWAGVLEALCSGREEGPAPPSSCPGGAKSRSAHTTGLGAELWRAEIRISLLHTKHTLILIAADGTF